MNAAADALCRRARTAELQLTEQALPDLARAETQRDELRGELRACEARVALLVAKPAPRPTLPKWLRVVWPVVNVAAATGAGYCVGARCPGEVTVAIGTAAAVSALGHVLAIVLF